MVGKDLIMATLLGSGGGSSGSGGGSAGVSPKEVNFYDYDGTCVHAYTVEEAQALSELPAGPEHPGLVFQGWNWSLEGVKGLTRAMNIGAMYTTDDGTTRLYITLQEGRTSPVLGVGVNGTVTVDWGDGTEPDVLTGAGTTATRYTPKHAYAAPGDYVIRLTVDGEIAIRGDSSDTSGSCLLRNSDDSSTRNVTYSVAVRGVILGNGVKSISMNAFRNCYGLEYVTIPSNVTWINDNTFYECASIACVVLPIETKGIGQYAFSKCRNLASIAIPDAVKSIDAYAFSNCIRLTSISIPAAMTTISSGAFNNCYGMAYYDFTSHTAVPTLSSTSAFTGIPADCEIRVPAALYDEWIAATNWATCADYIKAY